MFQINGQKWYINFVSPNNPMLRRSDGSSTLGACDNNTRTIYISDELDEYQFKKVLCHEITHCAMFSYDVDLSIEQEELLADLIATYGEEIIDITNKVFIKLKERFY